MNIDGADFAPRSPLDLGDDEVQVWRADLEAIRGEESRWREILSPEEIKRAARFHFVADRQRFIAARALLRTILGGYTASDPKDLMFVYSQKEKPSLGPMHASSRINFNISHSGEVALLAFTRGRDVGIDVERVRMDVEAESISKRYFSVREQEQLAALRSAQMPESFFRCWTRKEAYIKATGDGLSLPLHQFDVSVLSEDCDALLATRPDHSEAARWSLREIPAGVGYVAALCVRGREWRLKDWSGKGEERRL